MGTPHPYYRLNPARSIHISGTINRDMLTRVTPQILRLQALSRDPITVYIDSNGGHVGSMETLLRTLKLSDQDSSEPCHIITAVTMRAASAAADLLSSGDYAVAYPHSAILYHGIRTQESSPLTVESTSVLTNILRRSNDLYAIELARKIDDRFSFRFLFARDGFDDIRTSHNSADLSDVECFIKFIDGKLSSEGKKVWQRAKDRHERYRDLFATVFRQVKGKPRKLNKYAQMEAAAIKAIVDFELKENKKNQSWSFKGEGIERLSDDFFLFNEYISGVGGDRFQRWATNWGKYVLPKEVMSEIDATQGEEERTKKLIEKVRPIVQPLSSFFAAFCHALQEGENELTAEDAYWLGLIDEIVGRDDLLCLRHFEENQPRSNDGEGADKPSEATP